MAKRKRTSGREATKGVIPGRYSLSVGNPATATPPGWAWRPLLEVARLESGHTPSRRHPEYWGGDIPWIGIKDARAHHGREIHQTNECCTELGIANSAARVLPPGTVCLSRTASIGYIFRLGRPMATSQDFVNWVCDPAQLDPKFLMYVLLADVESLFRFAHGSTHQTIYYPEVKAFHACLPPIPTQRRIAGILSAYDDLIENNTKRIKILEEMARALYREWFVHFRFPGHEKVKLVDSPLGQIPEGWEVVELGGLLENYDKRRIPLSKRERADKQGEYPYYGASGVIDAVDDYIFEGRYLLIAEDGENLRSRKLPIAFFATGQFWVNNHAHVVRGRTPFTSDMAFLLLTERDINPYITGAAQPKLSQSSLNRIPVALAPESLLASFSSAVEPMLALADNLRGQNEVLRTMRDLLLPRLISGEIDVDALDLPEAAQ